LSMEALSVVHQQNPQSTYMYTLNKKAYICLLLYEKEGCNSLPLRFTELWRTSPLD
jgi:hypothetical protein